MTCFLKDKLSYLHLFRWVEIFSKYSGLKVNKDNTELFAIGRQRLEQTEFTHTVRSTMKILGVYFDYHNPLRMKANLIQISNLLKKSTKKQKNKTKNNNNNSKKKKL